ncbi:hypothetical protein [Actinoallomurus iriomotensis]|uniref:Uncharacterized protein n=1 Tax=Actinoallomurus iriomotensis TaxID=478107 RepID=A0A9W6SB10_9ACTN|nr:hypothetical protein [Actinoallomurus iriomotensis]GLY88962.1 hypothetical protein Airi02_068910 [Actinoallomurus iriomotensis]
MPYRYGIRRFLRWAKSRATAPLVEAPHGGEAVRRRSATDSYLFLLNHTGAQVA